MKFGGLLGPDSSDVQDVALLNRLIHYGAHGTTLEADPRHVQIVLDDLGLHGGKAVATPGVSKVDLDETPLSDLDHKRYRSLVMRLNYLALDRRISTTVQRSLQGPCNNRTRVTGTA